MPELANATDYVFVTKLIGAYDLQSELRYAHDKIQVIHNQTYILFPYSYKFCLIMKEDISKDEYLGACQIAILPVPNQNRTKSKSIKKELYSGSGKPGETDISDLNRIAEADRADDEGDAGEDQSGAAYYDEMLMSRMADDPDTPFNRMRLEEAAAAKLPSVGVSRMVLEGLGAVIIMTSLMAFIWGFIRLKSGRSNIPSMSTCYTVDERRGTVGHEAESRSRYFKLQATTSL